MGRVQLIVHCGKVSINVFQKIFTSTGKNFHFGGKGVGGEGGFHWALDNNSMKFSDFPHIS